MAKKNSWWNRRSTRPRYRSWYVYWVEEYHTKSFQHLTTVFMSTDEGIAKVWEFSFNHNDTLMQKFGSLDFQTLLVLGPLQKLPGVYRRLIFKIRPNILIGLQKLRLRPKDWSQAEADYSFIWFFKDNSASFTP